MLEYHGPNPNDNGISGFVIIAESHISVHTFPGRDYVNIDIFSCKSFDHEQALADVRSPVQFAARKNLAPGPWPGMDGRRPGRRRNPPPAHHTASCRLRLTRCLSSGFLQFPGRPPTSWRCRRNSRLRRRPPSSCSPSLSTAPRPFAAARVTGRPPLSPLPPPLEDYDLELDIDVAGLGIHTAPPLEPHVGDPHQMAERIRQAVSYYAASGKLTGVIGGDPLRRHRFGPGAPGTPSQPVRPLY